MNLRFLGDALDHWKGSVFEGLQNSNVLKDFHVDAMASDIEKWGAEDWSLYAKLLRVENSHIVGHETTLDRIQREKYFKEIPRSGDLFLDPDTGIMPPSRGNIRQYLKHEELFSIMNHEQQRIVAVYQHGNRNLTMRSRVENIFKLLHLDQPNCKYCSYYTSNAALLFLSFQRYRIKAVSSYFWEFLGSHADNRIYGCEE